MNEIPSEWRKRLHSLRQTLAMLGQHMAETADATKPEECATETHVAAQLNKAWKQFLVLRNRLVHLAEAVGVNPPINPEQIVSFLQLINLFECITHSQRLKNPATRKTRGAIETLDRIRQISASDEKLSIPLEECKLRAAEARQFILSSEKDIDRPSPQRLARDIMPFQNLLDLIRHCDTLEDEKWMSLHESVAEDFGEAIANAAARGRLLIAIPPGNSKKPPAPEFHSRTSAPSQKNEPKETQKAAFPAPGLPKKISPQRRFHIREPLLRAIQHNAEIPAFSASTRKLLNITDKNQIQLDDVVEIIRMDPGLTSKYLKLANSAAFGGESITDIQEAIMRIGFHEVRKIATAIEVLGSFSFLRKKVVDWNLFWLHSILTARLTQALANAFRDTSGKEYFAGLLHDIGKLFLEHFYPEQLDALVDYATQTGANLYEAETQILDITHPEVGEALCRRWNLDEEITLAIRYHHAPQTLPLHKDAPPQARLLAACICVSDAIANICKANIENGRILSDSELLASPEWEMLNQFSPCRTLDLDVAGELKKSQEAIQALGDF
ncbi:MAG: HDOD domain-containing protein [Verrucomicrobiae bacterium]|nr:HDOD domain-containing protein [Verrucomicrobiae bacterium]